MDVVEESKVEEEPAAETEEDKIKKAIEEIVKEDFRKTEIIDLRVNQDASGEEERYIVLVYLKWDVKNSAKTTQDMLNQYSDHLAAKMADNKLIYELVEFWEVPYHKEGETILKKTYENKEAGMFLKDEMNMFN